MEHFVKVLARQQKMKEHTDWRRRWFKVMKQKHGTFSAEFLAVVCRVGFDVQPEPHEAAAIIAHFRKSNRRRPFAIISAS